MKFLALIAFAVAAAPAFADGFGFRTPSGNIYCNGGLNGAHVFCTIVNREPGSAPVQAGTCPVGREIEVALYETGPAQVRCGRASGKLSTYTDIANYGVSAQFGRITCWSEKTGFQCANASQSGFHLSRRSQYLW